MGSLEVRVPSYSTTIPDSARVQREHEAARKTQQAWNSRQTWRRHTLDNIPFGSECVITYLLVITLKTSSFDRLQRAQIQHVDVRHPRAVS